MQANTMVYSVFIASPSDTLESRVAIREAMFLWNASHGKSRKVMLNPVGWETDASPEMGATPQDILNRQLLDDADILIAAFHTQLGTPTATSPSGTVEEIELSIAANRRVSIYFSKAPVNLLAIDLPEATRLKAYEQECRTKGLLAYYSSLDDLKKQLLRDLTHHVDALQGASAQPVTSPSTTKQDAGNAESTPVLHGSLPDGSAAELSADSHSADAWELLGRGEYEAGMRVAREELLKESSIPEEEWIAVCQYHAFSEGRAHKALVDLRQSVEEEPGSAARRFWYARALQHDGQLPLAESELRTIIAQSPSDFHRLAVRQLSVVLVEQERGSQAKQLLKDEISVADDPTTKSRFLIRLAELYSSQEEQEPLLESFLLRELAIDLRPNDSSSRFDLAHAYSEKSADQMAFVHYDDLLKRDPRNAGGANNAGVAASNLDLPFTSVDFYRKAEQLGDSLATSNLAWKLIGAGLEDEAKQVIAIARKTGKVHPNLEKAAGELVTRREREEGRLKDLANLVAGTRKFRVREARALLAKVDPIKLSGLYDGSPSSLILTAKEDGTISGSFSVDGKPATLSGNVEGGFLTFEWRTVPGDKPSPKGLLDSLYLTFGEKKGHGVLIAEEGSLNGYWTTEQKSLDPVDPSKQTSWKLERAKS